MYTHVFNDKYGMDENNVYKKWKCVCENNQHVIRVCMQVKELAYMRDKCVNGILTRGNAMKLLRPFVQGDFSFHYMEIFYYSPCVVYFTKCYFMANKEFQTNK
jgi:hypothetical protein